MRVVVTGATGFVGSHLVRQLLDRGHAVRILVRDPRRVTQAFDHAIAERLDVFEGDMTDRAAVGAALQGQESLVHAAAIVSLGRKDAERVLHANRLGTEIAVGGAVEAGLSTIVYVSSLAALLHPDGPPMHADSPVAHGSSPYSRSKASCEEYVRDLQAKGAPIQTCYPSAVVGPDDPGLSASNEGIRVFVRTAAVISDSGLQMVDVRDLAGALCRLVEGPAGPGRHVVAGHFLPWSELARAIEDVSERSLLRFRLPALLLRGAGRVGDVVRRVWDFDLPLTHEAMQIMTQWPGVAPAAADEILEPDYRPARDTLRDTLRWLHGAGLLSERHVGPLASAPDVY